MVASTKWKLLFAKYCHQKRIQNACNISEEALYGNSLRWKPFFKTFVAQCLFLDGRRSLGPSLIKYYFIITIFIASSINRDQIEEDDSCCVKLKVTLPNIVIRGGSGMDLLVAIALHWKLLNFVAESSILDRR